MEELVLKINGRAHRLMVAPWESLNEVIRERLELIGTKRGCETGGCGSCTVIVDGRATYSCMMYAFQAVGKEILTIEGISEGGKLDSVQRAFVDAGGLQCGYCTPGFIMSARALLDANPVPNRNEIKDAIVGNLCRCTGYTKIIESIESASKVRAKQKQTQSLFQ